MPAAVTNYEQAYRWKTKQIGKEMTDLLEKKNVKILTWLWQSGLWIMSTFIPRHCCN